MVNKKSSSLAQLKKSFTKAKTAFSRLGFWKTRFETPTPPSYKKRIYTQNLNYFSVANQSIWGEGDPDTISYLNSLSFSHKLILNVCAGDGRYNNLLLSKGARVVASDIDKSALAKLWHLTPKSDRLKLSIRSFDINKKFPFPNKFFDVVFCTGILHLFPSDFLEKHIFWEFKRVVKNKGRIIFDFAFDIKRIDLAGNFVFKYKNEKIYTEKEAEELIMRNFPKTKNIIRSFVHEDLTKIPELNYDFRCGFFLVDT